MTDLAGVVKRLYNQIMKSIWHWFVPNKKNKYHPHILRPIGLIIVALVLLAIPLVYNVTNASSPQVLGYATDISVSDVFKFSNEQRTANGLAPYKLNSQLNAAAYAKAQDMFAKDYWAHYAPDGSTTPWMFIKNAGYTYVKAGENLAMNFNSSSGVVTGWMNSPGHRANVLSTDFVDVGYAAVNGILEGEETTLVVAMYGKPYVAPTPVVAPVQSPPSPPATNPAPRPQPEPTPVAIEPEPKSELEPIPTQPQNAVPDTEPEPIKVIDLQETPVTTDVPAAEVMAAEALKAIRVYGDLNWGQKATLFVLSAVMLFFVLKHTIIWRKQADGERGVWLRAHPLSQVSAIVVMAIVTIMSGVGSIL